MGYNFSLFFVGNFERIGEILQQDGRFVKDYLNKCQAKIEMSYYYQIRNVVFLVF